MPKEIDGITLPRVTEVCKLVNPVKPLINAAIKVTLEKQSATAWDEYTKQAMQEGTDAHGVLERAIGGDRTGVQGISIKCLEAFDKWVSDYKVVPVKTEIPLTHVALGYTGTADLLCMIDGKRYIADFKTSKAIYDGYDMQLAAYAMCYDSLNPTERLDGIGVLRLDKDTGEYEWKDYTDRRLRAEDSFRALLSYWYSYKDRKVTAERAKFTKKYYKETKYFKSA